MDPVRFRGQPTEFERLRTELNEVLGFAGLGLGEDGRFHRGAPVKTLSEAKQRASRLRAELERRQVHGDVLRFCREELLQENYFHAVFEATKSVAEKIRTRTGLTSDGSELVDQAFGGDARRPPLLAFNSLRTPTEWSEHHGLMNLMKGMFGAFRNVTAHAPKVMWPVPEQDALDLLTVASLLQRRIDGAVPTR